MFHDILEKKAFLEYKNKKLKKSENKDFSKRISSLFLSKMPIFRHFNFLLL